MPDAQITIEKVWTSGGEGDYGPYTKYDVQPREDKKARYVTFKDAIGQKAQANVGRKVLVTYDDAQDGKNPKLTAVSDPLDDAAPTPGSGEYVKGKEPPETRRGIAASVALKEAVNRAATTPNPEAVDVLATAETFYEWLVSKTEPAEPQKPSQDDTGPATEEQQARLLLALDSLPPPPDGTESWSAVAKRFSEQQFDKSSSVQLTGYEIETLIEYVKGLSLGTEKVPF
jgi:hypothetical protein